MKFLKRIFNRNSKGAQSPSANGSMGVRIRDGEVPKSKARPSRSGPSVFKSFMPGRSVIYLLAAIVLIAGAVAATVYLSGNTRIQSVHVSGNTMTNNELIAEAAETQIGLHADSVRTLSVIENIEALPYIRRADVSISTLGRMHISVQEREPIGILVQGDAMKMVDADGIKMKIPVRNYPDVPLIYGFNINPVADTLSGEAFSKTVDFLTTLKRREVSMFSLSEVGWHAEDGIIALSRENGVRLVFGEGDYETRLAKWEEFYRQVVPQKGMAAFTNLDFRFRDQIVARES